MTRFALSLPLPLLHEQSTLEWAHVVNEEYAIEMVDLVLDSTRAEVRRLNGDAVVVGRRRLDHDAPRPVDIGEDLGNREAALLTSDGALTLQNHWIDQDDGIVVLCLHNGYAARNPNLVGCEADTTVCMHRVEKVTHEVANGVVDITDLRRPLAQDG
jgi:hypothetical protein